MKEAHFEQSPVDHHIQEHVLRTLFRTGGVVSFSELKPDDVQNSLFMYHVNKLEQRGLVVREKDGFVLTPNGIRWVNFVSPEKMKPRLIPRVLIKFLIFSPDRQSIVVSRRKSLAASEYINQYLLPSGFQTYGLSFNDSAKARFTLLTGQIAPLKNLGVHETIHRYEDGYIHHVVSPLFEATIDVQELPEEADYEVLWVPFDAALKGDYDTTTSELLGWYQTGKSFDGKTFDITVR